MVNKDSKEYRDELKFFLDDTDEHLQALEDNLIALENDPSSKKCLDGLFRAAHTLKGSSATFGHQKMATLTHHLETIFDKMRAGSIRFGEECFTVLLATVDVLKIFRSDLEKGVESSVDVEESVAQLQELVKTDPPVQAKKRDEAPPVEELSFSDKEITELESEEIKGIRLYLVRLGVRQGTEMPSVRLILILEELKQFGRVLKSVPAFDSLGAGDDVFAFRMLFFTIEERSKITDALKSFAELESFSAELVSIRDFQAKKSGKETAVFTDWKTKKIMKNKPSESDMSEVMTKKNIRVDVDRIEALMNITSELVIEKNRFLQIGASIAAKYEDDQEIKILTDIKEQVDKKISILQDELMKVRMVPLDIVFNKFPRMVRDLARTTGKEVVFHVSGSSVELDKSVIEEITDPLIHLLRNAVDHGIKGSGNVYLDARQSEGSVFIEVKDDGAGIDAERIRRKAVEKGLVDRETAAKMSDREAVNMIFLPGFSTAETVSETSGRGVGMDIVKTNIEKIQGTVNIDTAVGKGSSFLLKIPLTLAIIKALLIDINSHKFAIPIYSVLEIVKIDRGIIQYVNKKPTLFYRDSVLPLLWIREALCMEGSYDDGKKFLKIVVVGYGGKKVGFIIDDILGESEVVVYSLGKYIGNVKGLSGGTIDADGTVALILDVPSLIRSVIEQ